MGKRKTAISPDKTKVALKRKMTPSEVSNQRLSEWLRIRKSNWLIPINQGCHPCERSIKDNGARLEEDSIEAAVCASVFFNRNTGCMPSD